eukprot:5833526-Amphidinium_carterae.2
MLMQLARLLDRRRVILYLVWTPREKNALADAFTNIDFSSFSEHLHQHVFEDIDLAWVSELSEEASFREHLVQLKSVRPLPIGRLKRRPEAKKGGTRAWCCGPHDGGNPMMGKGCEEPAPM